MLKVANVTAKTNMIWLIRKQISCSKHFIGSYKNFHVFITGSRVGSIASTMVASRPISVHKNRFCGSPFSGITNSFMGFHRNTPSGSGMVRLGKADETHMGLPPALKSNPIMGFKPKVLKYSVGVAQENTEFKDNGLSSTDNEQDMFNEMEQRFLRFKKHRYLAESELFQTLSEAQSPKFMVIACADSRVCPSNILGFQPGEAFMVRNVANLIPPLDNGPSETNAALEFAVNTLEVEHILVIGHSGCGGIETLMKMKDDAHPSGFAHNWVLNAKVAKLRTQADAGHLSFDQQCRHCEKLSVRQSVVNLMTYPWIEERVRRRVVSLHGGYYNFLNCSFEKWSVDFNESGSFVVKHEALWQ